MCIMLLAYPSGLLLYLRFLGSLFGFVSHEHLCLLASGLLVCFVLLSALFLVTFNCPGCVRS